MALQGNATYRLFLSLGGTPKSCKDVSAEDLPNVEPTKSWSSFQETTNVYNCEATSSSIALGGIGVSFLFSLFCIAIGIFIAEQKQDINNVVFPPYLFANTTLPSVASPGLVAILPGSGSAVRTEVLSLALNVVVTICTEAIGFVHAVALKSVLASESRLRFNTNLRLLTATHERGISPNGALLNSTMVFLLIMSYVSSSVVFLPFEPRMYDQRYSFNNSWTSTGIFATPVIVLGAALFLQAAIALWAARSVKILTWSSSPLDVTAALLQNGQLSRAESRCMHNVLDADLHCGPRSPSNAQPCAWKAHPTIKKIIILLWSLVPVCVVWGGIVLALVSAGASTPAGTEKPPLTWGFLPSSQTTELRYSSPTDNPLRWPLWILILIIFAGIQGPLTLGLHCSEVIANIGRDEGAWRRASGKDGTKPWKNPLAAVLGSWLNLQLLIAKPVLHWMFGLSLNVQGNLYLRQYTQPNYYLTTYPVIQVSMRPAQIWYLAAALFVFALVSTFIATRCPKGPQPAAYGHLQTLANLVDEWSPTMWWGHKADGGSVSHAGTSDQPLAPVRMDTWYAGTDQTLL